MKKRHKKKLKRTQQQQTPMAMALRQCAMYEHDLRARTNDILMLHNRVDSRDREIKALKAKGISVKAYKDPTSPRDIRVDTRFEPKAPIAMNIILDDRELRMFRGDAQMFIRHMEHTAEHVVHEILECMQKELEGVVYRDMIEKIETITPVPF